MSTLREFVEYKLTHSDKTSEAEGYPLVMENCKKNKRMKQLEVYGNCFQDGTPSPENPIEVQCVGELVTDETDINYGKYKVPIVCRGKNYFSMAKTKLPQKTINGITFTPLDDERIHVTGKMIEPIWTAYSVDFGDVGLKLKAGQYRCYRPTHFSVDMNYGVYKGDSWLVNIAGHSGNVKEDGYIRNILIGIYASQTQELNEIINLCVERTSATITEYEPYVETIATNIYLDKPLGKADYIDFKHSMVIRNINTLNLGDLTYRRNKYNSIYLFYAVVNGFDWKYQAGSHSSYETFCDKYSSHTQKYDTVENYSLFVGNPGFQVNCVGIRNDDYTNVSDLKSSLADTIVYYTLANPIEEPLSLELPKLNAKTTIIEVDTSLAPSNISGKYIIR